MSDAAGAARGELPLGLDPGAELVPHAARTASAETAASDGHPEVWSRVMEDSSFPFLPRAVPTLPGAARGDHVMELRLGAQGTKTRSSSDTMPKSASAMRVRYTIAAKILAVSRFGVAASIT